MGHVRQLAVEIGHRPAGSAQNQAAAAYIERIFGESGLEVERQYFACSAWELVSTHLEAGGIPLAASANWRSLPCDVTGTSVALDTLSALEQADLTGKIALLFGELTLDEIAPHTDTGYYPANHKKLNHLLAMKQPLAVVAVCPTFHSLRQVFKDPRMPIPSMTVMPQVGLELLQNAGQPLHVLINSRRAPGQAWNVLGKQTGDRTDRIVLSAHFDTVWGTPGAFDNASGTGVLLALAQALAGRRLPVGLEFYASNAEEFGGQGSLKYMERYGLKEEFYPDWERPTRRYPIWDPILLNINIDGVGLALNHNSVSAMAASETLSAWVARLQKHKYPRVTPVPPWPASDHYTFVSHGVPAIAFCSTGCSSHPYHQPADTIQWISEDRLDEVVQFVLDLVEGLAGKSCSWCRPAS